VELYSLHNYQIHCPNRTSNLTGACGGEGIQHVRLQRKTRAIDDELRFEEIERLKLD
jgi:hypothetical protein